jgi:hypothetical protein
MIKQFEMTSPTTCLILSALLLAAIIFRIRNAFYRKNARVSVWNKEVGTLYRAAKLAMAVSLLFMIPGVVYFILIITLPSGVPGDYAKILFCIIFGAWAFEEIYLCFSIPEKLLKGSLFKRASFFAAAVFCMVVVMYFVPLIPRSLSYPAAEDCVMVDLPVRGTWLARHAGASMITNGHFPGHRYAVDILKLGPDGRIRRGRDEAITDFYSYNEPVYSPAAGRVVKVVNGLERDLIGNYVIIDIGNKKYVVLIHFRNGGIEVEEGQSVKSGALIGYVGNSGGSSGILHLHMQIQNSAIFERSGSVTYPFRFREMLRKRWLFREEVTNGYLLRNDRFSDVRN